MQTRLWRIAQYFSSPAQEKRERQTLAKSLLHMLTPYTQAMYRGSAVFTGLSVWWVVLHSMAKRAC